MPDLALRCFQASENGERRSVFAFGARTGACNRTLNPFLQQKAADVFRPRLTINP